MGSPMDVGVFVLIELSDSLNDCIRFLRCCSVVEPHQRPSMYSLFENRKVVPDQAGVGWPLADSEFRGDEIRLELELLDW